MGNPIALVTMWAVMSLVLFICVMESWVVDDDDYRLSTISASMVVSLLWPVSLPCAIIGKLLAVYYGKEKDGES